jgi:hypothetical protein
MAVTNEDHNRYIAYAFLGNAGFYVLLMGLMSLWMYILSRYGGPRAMPIEAYIFIIGFIAVMYTVFALPSIIAAYALLKKKSWARMAGIVAAVIAGMNFPIGTGACAYSLWFFFSDNWKQVYEPESLPQAEPRQIAYGVESQRAAYAEAERQPAPQFDPYNPPDWR